MTGSHEGPVQERKMESELMHLLRTYDDHKGISEQVYLRNLLSGVRCLASEL